MNRHRLFLLAITVYGILLSGFSYSQLEKERECKDSGIRTYWLLLSVIGACMVSLAVTSWVSCSKIENEVNTLPYIGIFAGLNVLLMFFSSLLIAQYNSSRSSGCDMDGKKTAVWYLVSSIVGVIICALLLTRKLKLNKAPVQAYQLIPVSAPAPVPGPPLPPRSSKIMQEADKALADLEAVLNNAPPAPAGPPAPARS